MIIKLCIFFSPFCQSFPLFTHLSVFTSVNKEYVENYIKNDYETWCIYQQEWEEYAKPSISVCHMWGDCF